MRSKHLYRLLSVFTVLVILIISCRSGASLQDRIVGNWQIQSETSDIAVIFSFKEDGTLRIWFDDVPIDGTYSWIDEGTIQMIMTEQNQVVTGKVIIQGDQMTITNEKGEIETLLRVE
jgi:phosphoribosylformimino-5-aminoimidazole carboxamide ribonucleotide (ProFAR) isomerase